MAVIPSKRQRYLAAQRDHATEHGLSVRLRPLPDIPPRFQFVPPAEAMTYELRIDKRRRRSVALGAFVHAAEGWAAIEVGGEAPEALKGLPAGCILATLSEDVLAVVWDESGGAEGVARLAAAMGELHQPK